MIGLAFVSLTYNTNAPVTGVHSVVDDNEDGTGTRQISFVDFLQHQLDVYQMIGKKKKTNRTNHQNVMYIKFESDPKNKRTLVSLAELFQRTIVRIELMARFA